MEKTVMVPTIRQSITSAVLAASMWLCVFAYAGFAAAAPPQQAAAGLQHYIVVLHVGPGAAPLSDADVTRMGGHVDFRIPGRLAVTLPTAASDALRRHAAVKYIQLVVAGSAPVTFPAADAPPPSILRVAPNALQAAPQTTPPLWNSGELRYDPSGNIYAIGTVAIPSSDQRQNTYTYDLLGRLVQATVNTDRLSDVEKYTYDVYGNLIARQVNNGTPETYDTDTVSNHLIGVTYDRSGNVIQNGTDVYAFDPFNQLRELDHGSQDLYVYDADDERIGVRTGGDTWTWSMRSFEGKVLRQYQSSDSYPSIPWLWLEDYVYGNGSLLGAERVAEEGGRRHFHLDHLGSPRLITGANGVLVAQRDFRPFGLEASPLSQETANGFDREDPMRFTGHERDFEDGTAAGNTNFIDYMHARYYRTPWARFLSVDPQFGVPGDPQSLNRYAYALNSPLGITDPTGASPEDIVPAGTITDSIDVNSTYLPHWSADDLMRLATGASDRERAEFLAWVDHMIQRTPLEYGRSPDYITFSPSWSLPIPHTFGLISVGPTFTLDRHGRLWIGPAVGVGKTFVIAKPIAVGLTAGWLLQKQVPSADRLSNFIGGFGVSAAGGAGIGAAITWGGPDSTKSGLATIFPGQGHALEVGLMTPQVSYSASWMFMAWQTPISW